MPYCTETDVKGVIETSLVTAQIQAIIAESDAEIDLRIGAQIAGDKVIQKLSKLMTAIQIKTRQPTSTSAAGFSETHDPIPYWQTEVDRLLSLYISGGTGAPGSTTGNRGKVIGSSYQHIDEDARYTEDVQS